VWTAQLACCRTVASLSTVTVSVTVHIARLQAMQPLHSPKESYLAGVHPTVSLGWVRVDQASSCHMCRDQGGVQQGSVQLSYLAPHLAWLLQGAPAPMRSLHPALQWQDQPAGMQVVMEVGGGHVCA
jgi:hypothetical protein